MNALTVRIRQLFCGHNDRETLTTPERGTGWTGTRTTSRCLSCGKDLRP